MDEATRAAAHIEAADPVLAPIVVRMGPPALRRDPPDPFRALTRAIVFQQLSGKAAATIHGRFLALFGDGGDGAANRFPEPGEVLALEDETLRGAGLSRQKIAGIRDLAAHVAAGELEERELADLDDEAVVERVTRVRGIGRWTAEMYLMFNLGRPDVLPVGDLGINRAIERLYGLPDLPGPEAVRSIGAAWRPWASAACWYLWRSGDVVLMGDDEPPPGGGLP